MTAIQKLLLETLKLSRYGTFDGAAVSAMLNKYFQEGFIVAAAPYFGKFDLLKSAQMNFLYIPGLFLVCKKEKHDELFNALSAARPDTLMTGYWENGKYKHTGLNSEQTGIDKPFVEEAFSSLGLTRHEGYAFFWVEWAST
jgi:hypothetical protein